MLSRVDLPVPDCPTTAISSPLSHSKRKILQHLDLAIDVMEILVDAARDDQRTAAPEVVRAVARFDVEASSLITNHLDRRERARLQCGI